LEPDGTAIGIKGQLEVYDDHDHSLQQRWKTHTKDNSEETKADTPATIMIARARLEPVPPPAAVMI
jgi:hypothetical protein